MRQDSTWKIFLKIVIPGLTIVFPIIGAILWFSSNLTYEPAILIIMSVGSGFVWFQSREDKKEDAQDKAEFKQTIADDGNSTRDTVTSEHEETRKLIQTTKQHIPVSVDGQEELDEADLKVLQRLWEYISWGQVYNLLNGCNMDMVYAIHIEANEQYGYARQNPANRLYDNELEAKLKEFDEVYEKILNEFGDLFVWRDSNTYIPKYKQQSYEHEYTHENLKTYKRFVNTDVRTAYKLYEEFTELLRQRGIYHKLTD